MSAGRILATYRIAASESESRVRAVVDSRVAINHVLGCLALLAVVWLVGYRWPRQSGARPPG